MAAPMLPICFRLNLIMPHHIPLTRTLVPQITQEKNSPFVRLSVLMFLAFWPSHSLVFLFFGLLWEWCLNYKRTRKYAYRLRGFLQGACTIDGKPIPGSPNALSRNMTVGGHVWGSKSDHQSIRASDHQALYSCDSLHSLYSLHFPHTERRWARSRELIRGSRCSSQYMRRR